MYIYISTFYTHTTYICIVSYMHIWVSAVSLHRASLQFKILQMMEADQPFWSVAGRDTGG